MTSTVVSAFLSCAANRPRRNGKHHISSVEAPRYFAVGELTLSSLVLPQGVIRPSTLSLSEGIHLLSPFSICCSVTSSQPKK